jgi:hypothetical protein
MGLGHLKIFFSRFTGPILTRLGTHHPWRERIQVALKEGDSPSPRGDKRPKGLIGHLSIMQQKMLVIIICQTVDCFITM